MNPVGKMLYLDEVENSENIEDSEKVATDEISTPTLDEDEDDKVE